MTPLAFAGRAPRDRVGLKGPSAPAWLAAHGIDVPPAPNSWAGGGPDDPAILVARLGSTEFFLEDAVGGEIVRGTLPAAGSYPAGVYPVLREDAAFLLSGAGSLDVLAQVCNVDFASLPETGRPVIMTLMIGVAVLVVPQGAAGGHRYRIWCDPTYGDYLGESIGAVVADCGGQYGGVSV